MQLTELYCCFASIIYDEPLVDQQYLVSLRKGIVGRITCSENRRAFVVNYLISVVGDPENLMFVLMIKNETESIESNVAF